METALLALSWWFFYALGRRHGARARARVAPITDAQRGYLARLARDAGEDLDLDGMTAAAASEHIDRLTADRD